MSGVRVPTNHVWLPVSEMAMAGAARRAAVALGAEAGLADARLGHIAIVTTELATNLARHADRGVMMLRSRQAHGVAGVEIVAIDHGPGMADVAASIEDGHSTAGTLGIGLGAVRRLTDELDIYSVPRCGTLLATTLWSTGPPRYRDWVAGLARPIAGEDACGDAYAAREIGGRRQILLCDGLGHGELAARAARVVVEAFLTAPDSGPGNVLAHLSEHARQTRGAVAAVAQLDPGRVSFAGIGNISGFLVEGTARRALSSMPGIVGHQHRDVREFEYRAGPAALVVLHSDGVSERWRVADYPGLLVHRPVLVAAALVRDAASRRDDAAVLVARVP